VTDQSVMINMRVTPAEKERLTKFAQEHGYTLSGFLREAAHKRALEILRANEPPATPLLHDFKPHPKWPWFCKECGYAPHEVLKHTPSAPSATRERREMKQGHAGIVRSIGWGVDEDGCKVFRAIVEYPDGPPGDDLPINICWTGQPVKIVVQDAALSSTRDTGAA
jgi:hypothetical protein